jgi:hypothetical protein
MRQDTKIDIILGKALRVLPETQLLKPVSDLLHCRPCSGDFLRRTEPSVRVVSRQICRIVCRRLLKAKQRQAAWRVHQRVFATAKSANGLGEVSAGHMDGERRYLDKTRGAMLKLRCAWIWRVDNAVAWIQGASW